MQRLRVYDTPNAILPKKKQQKHKQLHLQQKTNAGARKK